MGERQPFSNGQHLCSRARPRPPTDDVRTISDIAASWSMACWYRRDGISMVAPALASLHAFGCSCAGRVQKHGKKDERECTLVPTASHLTNLPFTLPAIHLRPPFRLALPCPVQCGLSRPHWPLPNAFRTAGSLPTTPAWPWQASLVAYDLTFHPTENPASELHFSPGEHQWSVSLSRWRRI